MPQTIDNMIATWNNAATTFTAIKMNVTDTASNASSLLMDLQVGGSSRFKINKSGNIISNDVSGTVRLFYDTIQFAQFTQTSWRMQGQSLWFDGDLFLSRRAAANLRLGAADTTGTTAPTAQTLSVQSWASSTNNNQQGANFTIAGSQGTGTGAGGSIIFQVAPAGGVSNGVQNALADILSLQAANRQAVFSGWIRQTGTVITLANGGFGVYNGAANLEVTQSIGLCAGEIVGNSPDVIIRRDAANTLALRNGANAQLLRVYARYDGTNDAYGAMGAAVNLDGTAGDANTLYIGSQKKGSPTALTKLAIQVDGTTRADFNVTNTSVWTFTGNVTTPNSFLATYDVVLGRYLSLGPGPLVGGSTATIYSNTSGVIQFSSGTGVGNGFDRLQFGGTTSSFPALKRSSTTLQARLADDSGFASVQGKLTTDTAYTAGDPTTTGYLVVYDSAGTAYKIPAVAV